MEKYCIPVFLASDDQYAPFVAVTIASICSNTASFINFYILNDGITDKNIQNITALTSVFNNFSIEFIKVNTHELFQYFQQPEHVSSATYSRFLIPEVKPHVNKAIYVDVDVIFLGNIDELYAVDLGGDTIGAKYEYSLRATASAQRLRIDLELSSEHRYFNAGVLLIDCAKWRERKILNDLFLIEKKYHERFPINDQDILNKYFDNDYCMLDDRFCLLNQDCYYFSKYDPKKYTELQTSLVIRHFNGRTKPWHHHLCNNADFEKHSERVIDHCDDFWRYAEMTLFIDHIRTSYTLGKIQRRVAQLLPILRSRGGKS